MNLNQLEFVVLAAGKSTRNYPHSKGIAHKSLLPLGDKKIIDYIINEIVSTGALGATFVVSDNLAIDSFKRCFAPEEDVQKNLELNYPKISKLLSEVQIPSNFNIDYIIQEKPYGLAHAIGLVAIKHPNKNLAIVLPDDIIINTNNSSIFSRFIKQYLQDNSAKNFFLTRKVEDISRWGIIEDGYLNEKPKTSSSNEASTMLFILNQQVTSVLAQVAQEIEQNKQTATTETHYSTYLNSIITHNPEMKIKTFPLQNKDLFFDCGTIHGYEQALLYFLLKQSVFKNKNIDFIESLIKQ